MPKYVFIIDEGVNNELYWSVGRFRDKFANKYNLVPFSKISETRFYRKLSPMEATERIMRKTDPEIVLFELLGDYLANSYKLRENGRKIALISKGRDYDSACMALYGNDMNFVRLNGKSEETRRDLDMLFL